MPWISFLDMSPENSIRDNALLFDEALLVLGYCSMKPTGIFATFIQAGLTGIVNNFINFFKSPKSECKRS